MSKKSRNKVVVQTEINTVNDWTVNGEVEAVPEAVETVTETVEKIEATQPAESVVAEDIAVVAEHVKETEKPRKLATRKDPAREEEKKKNSTKKSKKPVKVLTKGEMIREVVRVIIFSISLGVFSFALSGLIVIFVGYYSSQMEYKNLIDDSTVVIGTTESHIKEETNADGETVDVPLPEKDLYIPIQIDDEYYRAINSDYVMFIYIPDTQIKYPVVIDPGDERYLRYTFKGTENMAGAIFLDYRTDKEKYLETFNTVIAGHNRKDGTMFSDAVHYENESFRDQNPYIYIIYNGKEYVYEVFSFMTLTPVNVIYNPNSSYESIMEVINENNKYSSKREISKDDRIITLYTCNEDSSMRHLVSAVLVREY